MSFISGQCERCKGESTSFKGSYFNAEMICMPCKEKEEKHELYQLAVQEENKQVRMGNYNFEGIGLPNDLKV
jgi:hypothetical protein